jgi:hypothetical protein
MGYHNSKEVILMKPNELIEANIGTHYQSINRLLYGALADAVEAAVSGKKSA